MKIIQYIVVHLLRIDIKKIVIFSVFWAALPGLKGTVARDFLASVFFMDLLYMGLRFRGLKDFLFFFIFAKLFEYFDESAL
jgi:hypothetical protein